MLISSDVPARIAALRDAMAAAQLDAWVQPANDPHQSEYVADHWQARAWLSGFTGSAGTLVVTLSHAGLWTDGRYVLQAEAQLAGTGITLHRQAGSHASEYVEWLTEYLPWGSVIGVDGRLVSMAQARRMERLMEPKHITLEGSHDLVAPLWEARPPMPATPVFAHDAPYAGLSRAAKLAAMHEVMEQHGATDYFVSALDDIAWLLNLRAADVDCNPVLVAYLALGPARAHLFTDTSRIPGPIREALAADGVQLAPYEMAETHLGALPADARMLLDPATTSLRMEQILAQREVIHAESPAAEQKAVKADTEIQHIREAMRKDGVALVQLFAWLEDTLRTRTVTEVELAEQLTALRSRQAGYVCESFPAIVGYGANGAIIHYRPEPGHCADIRAEGLLLLDSGGQYLDGTTDVTRTVALGPPTEAQRRHYTLVLKGHIGLDRAVFPTGTTGLQLDVLARQALWAEGLDYGHGTGHGVGFFLGVHEGPHGIATAGAKAAKPLRPGTVTSNEPGFYLPGAYGIRIENLILCQAHPTHEGFLCFEPLTLCPLDAQLVDADLLLPAEREWLRTYHHRVQAVLAPCLEGQALAWLLRQCEAFGRL